jgi:hypothetical protein
VDAAARRQGDAEHARQDAADLAVRQSRLLVQLDDRGLSVRPQLRRSSPQSVRGLQRLAALDSATALLTTADVDIELPVDRLSWDFDLILLIDMGWLDRTPAVGASIG